MLVSWEPFDFGPRKANVEAAESTRRRAEAGVGVTRLEVATAAADSFPVGVLAHVTNAIGHDEPFDKGGAQVGHDIFLAICRASQRALKMA